MVTFRISAAIGVAAFCLGTLIAAQTKTTVSEIVLERTPCFGSCPVYKVTLKPDGTILYQGIRFVPRIGKFTAQIYGFDRIAALVDRFQLNKMKDRYAVTYTDQATTDTTIKTSAGTKTISVYGPSGPDELWAFDKAIDGLVADARNWEKAK